MDSFRHNPDDFIIINETLILPLDFFLTQEPTYVLPSGAITQQYIQGSFRKWQDETNETSLSIPWTEGDNYIANIATYSAAYSAYLAAAALPQTLAAAKTYQKNLLNDYANTILNGNVVYDEKEYPISLSERLRREAYYFARIGQFEWGSVLGIDHYVLDKNNTHVDLDLYQVAAVLNLMDKVRTMTNQNIDTHSEAIDALTTINAVLAYDYTTGWLCMPYNAARTFYVSYATSINGTCGEGSLTGTAVGGAAILNGKLDLAHNDNRYVSYSAVSNADFTQTGAVRFIVTPNYSGSPAIQQQLFSIGKASGNNTNLISLRHASNGLVKIYIYNSSAVSIINDAAFSTWSPTSGTPYLFELNIDLTTGATRLFVDGVQKGSTLTQTGTRSTDVLLLHVGQYVPLQTFTSNFSIEGFKVYNTVQHTSGYTP